MHAPSKKKWSPRFGPTTHAVKFWPCWTCIPSNNTYTGKNARLNIVKCTAEKAVVVNNNTAYTGYWLMIPIMNAGVFFLIGSDFHRVAFVSATICQWSSGLHQEVPELTETFLIIKTFCGFYDVRVLWKLFKVCNIHSSLSCNYVNYWCIYYIFLMVFITWF